MEPREKLELRKEITDEVREDLTRAARKDIQERILLALCILALEAFFWIVTMVLASKVMDGYLAFVTAMVFCFLRCTQMNLAKEFGDD